jgi:hypothetical protein
MAPRCMDAIENTVATSAAVPTIYAGIAAAAAATAAAPYTNAQLANAGRGRVGRARPGSQNLTGGNGQR